MEFTIYSIGESAFLEQILISVSAISGSGDMAKLAAIGGLLGVIFVLVQGIFQGAQSVNFQHVFLGWVIYLCLFGPVTRVLIEDSYSGHVRVVDNVPISVGIAGGVISKIGYGITNLFEQGFGAISPGDTRSRYMESLEVLTELQRNGNDSAIFTALNHNIGANADIRRSWDNYIRECTTTKIDLGETTLDDMARLPILEALRFDSGIYGTQIFLPNEQNVTCTEAYPILTQNLNRLQDGDVLESLNRVLGYDPADAAHQSAPPMERAQVALHALGANMSNAYDFMKLSILEPLYNQAILGKHQDLQDHTAAIMINQAIQQRNTQWAAEQSMFMTVARPLMAFFEGFIYAVTPVLAFLIMLGGMGLSLAMKYVQSLLWIQLWMPTLAITNLYIHTAVTHEMASKLNVGGEAINSMYALNTSADILGNWIAVGGMLAAATPMISLFFVTGSTYAFTSLAQRIGGADHVNEKLATPDIIQGGAVAQYAPQYQGDTVRGLQASGTESLMSGVTMGSGLASAVSSAQTKQNQTAEQFQEQLNRSWENSWAQGNGYTAAASLGASLRSSENKSVQALVGAAHSYGQANGWSDEQTNALIGTLGAKAGAAIKTGAPGGSGPSATAGFDGGSTSQAVEKSGITSNALNQVTDSVGYDEAMAAALSKETAKVMSGASDKSWSTGFGDKDVETLSKTATEAVAASETYSQLDSATTTATGALNTDTFTLGARVAGNDEASRQLDAAWLTAPSGAKTEAARLEEIYKASPSNGGHGMDAKTAKAAARMTAMMNPAHYKDGGYHEGFNNLLGVAGAATGRTMGVEGDPERNSALAGPAVENVQARAEASINAPERLDRNAVGGKAAQEIGTPNLEALHGTRSDHVKAKGDDWKESTAAAAIERAQAELIHGSRLDHSAASQIFAPVGQASQFSAAQAKSALMAFLSRDSGSYEKLQEEAYNKAHDFAQDRNLTPAQTDFYATYASFQDRDYQAVHDNLLWEVRERNSELPEKEQMKLYENMSKDLTYAAYRANHAPAATAAMAGTRALNMAQASLRPGG